MDSSQTNPKSSRPSPTVADVAETYAVVAVLSAVVSITLPVAIPLFGWEFDTSSGAFIMVVLAPLVLLASVVALALLWRHHGSAKSSPHPEQLGPPPDPFALHRLRVRYFDPRPRRGLWRD